MTRTRRAPAPTTSMDGARRAQIAALLDHIFRRAHAHFGPLHWWPAESREEVILGAILTQNTAWTGVEKALDSLRAAAVPLTLGGVLDLPTERLGELIRPAGYFRQKAERLQTVARWFLDRCGSREASEPATAVAHPRPRRPVRAHDTGTTINLAPLIGTHGPALERLRADLLAINGIGPETADSILLYALDCPTFVIDAYTLRIAARHGLFPEHTPYEQAKLVIETLLTRDTAHFNEYHAQIVYVGKEFCLKSRPRCAACPLNDPTCFAPGVRPPIDA